MNLILYIDSDPTYRRMISDLLTAQGFAVALAGDGLQGLIQARQLQPELILLDLNLPRIDGLELIKQLKAYSGTCRLPLIFMSRLPADWSARLAEETGTQGFITKPFRPQDILQLVQQTIPA